MAPTVSYLCLSLLLLLLTPLSSSARTHYTKPSQSSKVVSSPKTQAQKLIQAFNLSPKHAFNTGSPVLEEDSLIDAPLMVEKTLIFPNVLGDPANNSIQFLGHHAGYYRLPHTVDARMFYFFFESRKSNKSAPVVIWLSGGPGCSSELALFYENGPFHISNNLSLIWNDFGWDQESNLIFVDQPTGTGFSYSSSANDTRHNEESISNDLYDFLQELFKQHGDYANNDFYITGESYAGHYIPAFASRVDKGNKANEGIFINLKGFAIGNGLTNPAIQFATYPDFALYMKLINQSEYSNVTDLVPPCEQATQACATSGSTSTCTDAFNVCMAILDEVLNLNGTNLNVYDIRKQCEGPLCYNLSNVVEFLNQKAVREALGVGDIQFVTCSNPVYDAMLADWMKNLEVGIPALLEGGINMLIYAGEYDLICNWLGNYRWVNLMQWSGQNNFTTAPAVPFVVDGALAGIMKSYGSLTFLKVFNAGHLVPMDQPKAALEVLKRWTQGTLTVAGDQSNIPTSDFGSLHF
ncbi:hypothetical protein ACSBR2_033077 [Camellia fascicularis]